MRFYLISDNVDTQLGMRLAGIEGVVVHEEPEVRKALKQAMDTEDIAVVLMTERLVSLCPELIYDLKLNRSHPLIVEIPCSFSSLAIIVLPAPATYLSNMYRTVSAQI